MDEQPRDSDTIQPVPWQRMTFPLLAVLAIASYVCRRDLHLSWLGIALVLVVIAAAAALWWRFATHTLLPRLSGRHGTWQTRSGHFKVSVTCKSCGNSTDVSGDQWGPCPSCGMKNWVTKS